MKNFKLYEGILKGKEYCLIKGVDNFEDFKKVIKVFSDAPYNEILTLEDCINEYYSYEKNGFVVGAYVDGNIAGINCILNDVPEDYSIKFHNKKRIAYYSGLAVKSDYRKLGLGKLLVSTTDKYLQELDKYDYSFARIRCVGSMSEGIFKINDFHDAYEHGVLITDDVLYLRNTGNYEEDKRKYMVKRLNDTTDNYYYRG